jgi:hypothetical protein
LFPHLALPEQQSSSTIIIRGYERLEKISVEAARGDVERVNVLG